MQVTIWGARGSIPTPLLPEQVEQKIIQAITKMPVLDTTDEGAVTRYVHSLPPLQRGTAGGNTTCVQIQAGPTTLVVDAGSGIRELAQELMKGPCSQGKGSIHLFFSHPHWDHIQGFPFFYLPMFQAIVSASTAYTIYAARSWSSSGRPISPCSFPKWPPPLNMCGSKWTSLSPLVM
ncbi:MAG: hypothetical protein R3A44_35805 [Caldilineaceae bacterium]